MPEHTPGPWKAARVFAHNAPDSFKVFTKTFGGVCVADCGDNEDNAKIVAAAPELAEALAKLLVRAEVSLDQSATHDGLVNCKAIAAARAILAKLS